MAASPRATVMLACATLVALVAGFKTGPASLATRAPRSAAWRGASAVSQAQAQSARARIVATATAAPGAEEVPKWRADLCDWDEQELLSLTGERDACGVGFIASQKGEASRRIVQYALNALTCMEHRGGCSADDDSGDGAGVLTNIPWKVVLDGLSLDQAGGPPRGLGMIFLPPDEAEASVARKLLQEAVEEQGLTVAAWRVVPVDSAVLGRLAAMTVPRIEQLVIGAPTDLDAELLEARLYEIRRRGERLVLNTAKAQEWKGEPYIASLSGRTVVYKGMVRSAVLDKYYLDLQSDKFESALAIYHRRFSTNTMPRWSLAQPMRVLGHNGEINTLLGNLNWMRAREREIVSEASDRVHSPLVDRTRSDSANLDGAAELLARQPGRDLPEALMVLVPEAFESNKELDGPKWAGVADFYKYHALLQESWDGPALLVFSDGKWIGATLDRNGLRPARYLRTSDGLICMMSETGVVPVPHDTIVEKGRLGPGQMIAVEVATGKFFHNNEIKPKVASRADYAQMLANQAKPLPKLPWNPTPMMTDPDLVLSWTAFGWSMEDVAMGIADMASSGKETTFCMGDDSPLAAMSTQPHMAYDYLKQRFAQVTNPPIDPIREGLVMSLNMIVGQKDNVLLGGPEHLAKTAAARGAPTQLELKTPLLNDAELAVLEATPELRPKRLSTRYSVDLPGGLPAAIEALRAQAIAAVEKGAHALILSDKPDASFGCAASAGELFIPPLLAVGAVHHDLLDKSLRLRSSIVVQTGQAWSTHHLACLIGYGASAVHPYLAYERCQEAHCALRSRGRLPDPQDLLLGRDVARRAQPRGARDDRRRDEPHRWQVELGGRRRGPPPLRADQRRGRDDGHLRELPAPQGPPQRRLRLERRQADRLGPLRRHCGLPGERTAARDQDGSGRQAGRGWPVAGREGGQVHRRAAQLQGGHHAHLAAAAPRHLLHRGPCSAGLRPARGQPARASLRQARRRGGHRHGRRGRREGQCGRDPDLGPRRRHGRTGLASRGLAVGAGPGRGAPDARLERPARARDAARGRRPQDRLRLRLRHHRDDCGGVHHGAHLPHQQVPRRRHHA
ncbi:nucleophile aminohydrolase, partial [Pavlovales sp. CCMP2436]